MMGRRPLFCSLTHVTPTRSRGFAKAPWKRVSNAARFCSPLLFFFLSAVASAKANNTNLSNSSHAQHSKTLGFVVQLLSARARRCGLALSSFHHLSLFLGEAGAGDLLRCDELSFAGERLLLWLWLDFLAGLLLRSRPRSRSRLRSRGLPPRSGQSA